MLYIYVLDLGPGAGDRGGELIATGTPEKIMTEARSLTGDYLKPLLNGHKPEKPAKPAKVASKGRVKQPA